MICPQFLLQQVDHTVSQSSYVILPPFDLTCLRALVEEDAGDHTRTASLVAE